MGRGAMAARVAVLGVAAVLALAGCLEPVGEERSAGAPPSATPGPAPTPAPTPTSTRTPSRSAEEVEPVLSPGTGAIVPADAVPAATTGPGRLSMLDGLAAEERAAVLARWDDSGCAPWTLMVDQHNGELTLEEYTELSYRSLFQPQPSGEAPPRSSGTRAPGALRRLR